MKSIKRFFRQASITYKSLFGVMDIKIYVLTKIFSPLVSMLFFCYLAMYAYGADNMAPWVIGNAFATCVFPVFLGAGLVMRIERGIGTLKAIIATPTNRIVIFTSRSLMHVLDAAMVAIISLTTGILVFGVDFSHVNLLLLAAIIFVSMMGAISLGMVVSSLGLVVRDIHMIMNVGILGLIILSGANVPVDMLPSFLRWLSMGLPVNRGIQAARLLYDGGSLQIVYRLMGEEALLAIIYMCFGFLLYKFFEYQARKHATLDLF